MACNWGRMMHLPSCSAVPEAPGGFSIPCNCRPDGTGDCFIAESASIVAGTVWLGKHIYGGHVKTSELTRLTQAVEQLIREYAELKQHYVALKQAEIHWQEERAQLVNKNEQARQKVEAMIFRLKALERDS